MGILAPLPPRADDHPNCQPGAYLVSPPGHLYYILEFQRTGPDSGMVLCENCRTGYPVKLTVTEAKHARLIKAAPTLVVPDVMPDEA